MMFTLCSFAQLDRGWCGAHDNDKESTPLITTEDIKTDFPKTKIYPNPTSEYLEISGLDAKDFSSVSIVNSKGIVLQEQLVSSKDQTMTFETRDYDPGLFIVIFNPTENTKENEKKKYFRKVVKVQ